MKVSITDEATTNLTRVDGALMVRSEGILYKLSFANPMTWRSQRSFGGALAECKANMRKRQIEKRVSRSRAC